MASSKQSVSPPNRVKGVRKVIRKMKNFPVIMQNFTAVREHLAVQKVLEPC